MGQFSEKLTRHTHKCRSAGCAPRRPRWPTRNVFVRKPRTAKSVTNPVDEYSLLTRCSEETIMTPVTGTPEGSKPHALNCWCGHKNRHWRLQSERAAQRKAGDQRGG